MNIHLGGGFVLWLFDDIVKITTSRVSIIYWESIENGLTRSGRAAEISVYYSCNIIN